MLDIQIVVFILKANLTISKLNQFNVLHNCISFDHDEHNMHVS